MFIYKLIMKKLKCLLICFFWGSVVLPAQVQETHSFSAHKRSYGLEDAVFSPDSKMILTSGQDSTAKLWDLEGKLVQAFSHPSAKVKCVAFAPDGKRIASSDEENIRIWEAKSGKLLRTLPWKDRYSYSILDLSFSPDGQYLLSAHGTSPFLKLWDSKKGALIHTLKGRGTSCTKATFSPDGKYILAGCGMNLLYWETASGQAVPYMEDLQYEPDAELPKNKVGYVATSADGKQFLTWNSDWNSFEFYDYPRLKLWDWEKGLIQKFQGQVGEFEALFVPGHPYLLTGGTNDQQDKPGQSNGHLNLWDQKTGELLASILAHPHGVRALQFSPDGQYLMSAGGKDREVKIWDTQALLQVPQTSPMNTTTQSPRKSPTTPDNEPAEISLDELENIIQQESNYYALIISVKDYKDAQIEDLAQPELDADALKKTLGDYYTFESEHINRLKNPTRAEIIQALDQLTTQVTPQDNLLIFYAGHGHWDEQLQQGYWLPADAQKSNRANWLANSELGNYIRGIRSRHTLLITDACFSGTILMKTRRAMANAPKHIQNLYQRDSRKAITSGTKEEVPDQSVFVEYLLRILQENQKQYLIAQELFNYVLEPVTSNTRNAPQYGVIYDTGHEGGEFIFVKR